MLDLPLEYALIVFDTAHASGKIVPQLLDLAQREIVRIVDIVFVRKDEAGVTETIELADLDPKTQDLFIPLGRHVSRLFSAEGLEIAASQLDNNSAALLILWENLWMADLRAAISEAGGALVDRATIAPERSASYLQALAES